MVADAIPVPAVQPEGADPETTAIFVGLLQHANTYADGAAADAVRRHGEADTHLGRQQRRGLVFGWDSGASGTALVAASTLPRALFVPFPCQLVKWRVSVPYPAPAGSATFDVLLVEPDAAMSTATTIVTGGTPTLSSGTTAEGDALSVWPTTSIDAGSWLIGRLLTCSTVEVVELQLEARAT